MKLVDAKFPLPCRGEGEESKAAEPGSDDAQAAGRGTQNAQAAGWVCLDSPEWPSECDDIMIGFESEAGMLISHLRRAFNRRGDTNWNRARCVCRGVAGTCTGA